MAGGGAGGRRRGFRQGVYSIRSLLDANQTVEYTASNLSKEPSAASCDGGSDVFLTVNLRNKNGFHELVLGEGLSSHTKVWRRRAQLAQSKRALCMARLEALRSESSDAQSASASASVPEEQRRLQQDIDLLTAEYNRAQVRIPAAKSGGWG